MNWKELIEKINQLTPEQQATDVTIYVGGVDEYYPVDPDIRITAVTDVLDINHPYLEA